MNTAPTSDDNAMRKKTELTDSGCENILRFMDMTAGIERLSDGELSDLVIKHVWARKVDLGTPEEAMLDNLISRFDKLSGVTRDEHGNRVSQ